MYYYTTNALNSVSNPTFLAMTMHMPKRHTAKKQIVFKMIQNTGFSHESVYVANDWS